jgi:hypothetical protein
MRSFLLLCGLLTAVPWTPGQAEDGTASGVRKTELTVLCSRSIFRGLNATDVVASGRVWIRELAKRYRFDMTENVEIVSGIAEIRKRLQAKNGGLVLVDSVEFLTLAMPEWLEPFCSIARPGGVLHRYYLLAHRDSGVSSLGDLKAKPVHLYSRTDSKLARMWLEVSLNEKGLGRADRFFSTVSDMTKPSSACLPVFFSRTGACIIDEGSFSVLKDMNPQLGAQLKILASSAPLLESVMALDVRHGHYRAELQDALRTMHQEPQGRQLLMLLKGERAVPVARTDLEGVNELLRKYMRFAGALPEGSGVVTIGRTSSEEAATWPR